MKDWEDLLPRNVASSQEAYERRHSFLRAVDAGATQAEIAKAVGLSRGRVGTIVFRAMRERACNRSAPIVLFIAGRELYRRPKKWKWNVDHMVQP